MAERKARVGLVKLTFVLEIETTEPADLNEAAKWGLEARLRRELELMLPAGAFQLRRVQ